MAEQQHESLSDERYIDDWCADPGLSHDLCTNSACECPCHAIRVRNKVTALLAENAALTARLASAMSIVQAVASANPYGSWLPAGVVCRWCMERALSPKECQHDHECTFRQARALVAELAAEEQS